MREHMSQSGSAGHAAVDGTMPDDEEHETMSQ
jgi:hypothetical protein